MAATAAMNPAAMGVSVKTGSAIRIPSAVTTHGMESACHNAKTTVAVADSQVAVTVDVTETKTAHPAPKTAAHVLLCVEMVTVVAVRTA